MKTIGYIVTIDSKPAGWQARFRNLHYAGGRATAHLFASRKDAQRAINADGAERAKGGLPQLRVDIVRVVG